MNAIPAVFENGIFRPVDPIDIPEGTRVDVVVPAIPASDVAVEPTPEQVAARKRVWELLSHSFDSGEPTNILETHNDHQP
ncbi:MAG TPA: antitoxin family protein [Planctomycetaceae bacterium]|nr:antitoxin family protein [Planctomycetaceae bacterium]